jgi:glycosyltransferase involved in cell wall biosynthesis
LKKLAVITTHPIQYYAPVFERIHQRDDMELKVFYTWGVESVNKYDPGFKKNIAWDIPLLENYPYEWVKNVARKPGSHHFFGIQNPELIELIEKWQPDAILVYGWSYYSHLKAIRYFKNKVPVFFRGDSTLLDRHDNFKNRIKNLLLKWVYSHVDHAFYVGQQNKKYFLQYGLKAEQLSFAPHAIDNARFEADKSAEAAAFRASLAIADDEILLLFAGKIVAKKDPAILLKTFAALNHTKVHLLFVGNGHLEDQLKAGSTHLKNIHFFDFQNQTRMPVIYQACNLFVLPSRGPGDTWGLAVNEAMACGKAVLVSDKVGCADDLIKAGINGAIFKAGDLDSLSTQLKKLLDLQKLKQMGEASKAIIRDWNFEHIAQNIGSVINNYEKKG